MLRKLIGLAAVLLSLAGCGGGDAAETTAPATTATTALAATAAEGSEVVPIEAEPCDLLTVEEVEAATGLTVEEVRDEPPIYCDFDLGSEAGVYLQVIIEDGEGRFGGPANLLEEYLLLVDQGEAEMIGGLGEQAVCCPFRAIAVDAGGGRFFAVAVGGSYAELAEPLEVLVTLARSVLGRL
jgi:hypothetical protein